MTGRPAQHPCGPVQILVYKEAEVYNPTPAIVNEDALTVNLENTGSGHVFRAMQCGSVAGRRVDVRIEVSPASHTLEGSARRY